MILKLTTRLALLVPVAALSALASADVAFNDFGLGNGGLDYQAGHGWRVGGALSVPYGVTETACQFTSSATGLITDL
ncbi:MAG TPA: hypothetical protein VKT78_00790, partial [Fimbriimonadaceae bacterium]|nr:hypothetical protein [Fimbriimonadaceae bacterium]